MDASLTHSGIVLGTPAYMSPEQAGGRARELTTASDIYSLGAVLYECLTARPPFTADSSIAVLRQVAEEEPPRPSTIRRDLDSDLETICLRCLEKEPTARYRSMLALAGDLERWLRGEPILARPVTSAERVWKWARRHPALAALWSAVALLVITVAVVATALSVSLARYNKTVLASAETLRHQLARELAGSSQRLVEADDWLRALPPLAEAIRLGTGNERLDRANRVRFATLVRSSPDLRYVWADGRKILRVDTDAGGRYLLVVTPQSADLWNLEPRPSLKYRWNATGEWRLGALMPDGSRGVLSTAKEEFVLLDCETGATLGKGDGAISATSVFATFGRHFITFKGTNAVIRSTQTGQPILPPFQHVRPVSWAAALPWQRFALTRDDKGKLYLWDGPSGSTVTPPFTLTDTTVNLAGVAGRNRTVALQGGRDVYLLDGLTGTQLTHLETAGRPQSVGLDMNGQWLYQARRDTGVDLREVEAQSHGDGEGDRLRFSPAHGALGFRGAFASESDLVATQSWNGSARVWKLSNGRSESPFLWEAATPADCLLDQRGRWLLTRSDEPAMRLWSLRREEGASFVEGVSSDPIAAWFDGSPERLRIAERNGRVHLIDPTSGKIAAPPLDHGEPIHTAASCAMGRRLFTCSRSRAQIWDALSGGLIGKLFVSGMTILHGAADPKGELVAATVEHVGVIVWDCSKGAEQCRIDGEALRVEFSPDGSSLLITRPDGAQVFDATTGAAISPAVDEPDKRTEARFSPDGRRVLQWSRATRSGQNAARIWDAATGAIETTLEGHWRAIDDAAFSPGWSNRRQRRRRSHPEYLRFADRKASPPSANAPESGAQGRVLSRRFVHLGSIR
jgi:WD40 repeat protein